MFILPILFLVAGNYGGFNLKLQETSEVKKLLPYDPELHFINLLIDQLDDENVGFINLLSS